MTWVLPAVISSIISMTLMAAICYLKHRSDLKKLANTTKNAEKERKRLLKSLEQKNAELQNIVYVASHDMRSPLVNIQGFSGELERDCSRLLKAIESLTVDQADKDSILKIATDDIPSSLKFIKAGTAKMDLLVTGLLQLSRVGTVPLDVESLDMNLLVKNSLRAMRFQVQQCGAQITVDELPECRGDWVQVNQVFSNLIDNALKYRDLDRKLEVRISGSCENGFSKYLVSDTGIGISEEQQAKVFEVFHRLDNGQTEGEGLGLTIVKRILNRLEGSIEIESETGIGTVFTVILPTN